MQGHVHSVWQVDALQELEAGCDEEVEIRGCTIHAVELLREALQARCAGEGMSAPHSVQLDWFLWERGERERDSTPAHHRTLTTFY
jgi:hypothetical protein